jgi:hypothetical protein
MMLAIIFSVIGCRSTGLEDVGWAKNPNTHIHDDQLRLNAQDCEDRLNKIRKHADSSLLKRDWITGLSAGISAAGVGAAGVLQIIEAQATPPVNASATERNDAQDATDARQIGTMVGLSVAFATTVLGIILDRTNSSDDLRREHAMRSAEYWQGRSVLSNDRSLQNGSDPAAEESRNYATVKNHFENCVK